MTAENDLFRELYRILRLGKKFLNVMEPYNGCNGTEQLYRNYTVSCKKRATMFSIITLALIEGQFLRFLYR